MLSVDEIALIDAYHADVLQKLTPLLQSDSRALTWLQHECQPL